MSTKNRNETTETATYLSDDLRVYAAETVVYRDGTIYRIRQIDQRIGGRWVPSFDVRKFEPNDESERNADWEANHVHFWDSDERCTVCGEEGRA